MYTQKNPTSYFSKYKIYRQNKNYIKKNKVVTNQGQEGNSEPVSKCLEKKVMGRSRSRQYSEAIPPYTPRFLSNLSCKREL